MPFLPTASSGASWHDFVKNYGTSRGALICVITVDDDVIQHARNVSKSRKPNLDLRGIYTENFRVTAEAFSPE